MRLKLLLILGIILIMTSLGSVIANIQFGNLSHEIEKGYITEEVLRGWVNFSLNNQPGDTLITGFNNNITLQKFLENNGIICDLIGPYDCSCFPKHCEPTYSLIGSSATQKIFNIGLIDKKIFGVKLTGNVSRIVNFSFDVSTDAGESCIKPLILDLFNDDNPEFKAYETSSNTCSITKPYGCYKSEHKLGVISFDSVNKVYCGVINVPPMRGFQIGAKIEGNGIANFQMIFDSGGGGKTCIFTVSSSGEGSCNISLADDLGGYTNATVCISAFSGQGGPKNATSYNISYEDNEKCGYVEAKDENNRVTSVNNHDFEIFAKPLKYSRVSNFKVSQAMFSRDVETLNQRVFNYINSKYSANCNPECIVPVKILSGIKQNVTISNLFIDYEINGLNTQGSESNSFYELGIIAPLFTSEFLKLYLEKANITVPLTEGEKNFILNIGDKTIRQNISVMKVPKIIDIIPRDPVFLVPTSFKIILDATPKNNSNLTYTWDFGDKSLLQTTTTNNLWHTYNNKTTFLLTANVSNNKGTSSKTVAINVASPYNAINKTIARYKENLARVKITINSFSDVWMQIPVETKIRLEDLQRDVTRLENKYKDTRQSDDDELVKIMKELVALRIPAQLEKTVEIKKMNFFQNPETLDLGVLEEGLELGAAESGKDEEDYAKAINSWLMKNLNMTIETKTYSLYYDDGSGNVLFSHVKINLKALDDVDVFYIVVNKEANTDINFKETSDVDEIDEEHKEIKVSNLNVNEPVKVIEFLYPDSIKVISPPIFVSPEFRELEFTNIPEVICNKNGKCEGDETPDNCRADCKPWNWMFLWLGIVLAVVFIGYIILQEWYKKHYENYLFKDKNKLFNLVTFISIGVNQKMDKDAIFEKLKPMKWSKEQMDYAWKKMRGERTGMWEIPIFRPFEKKKVQQEIEKRKVELVRGF